MYTSKPATIICQPDATERQVTAFKFHGDDRPIYAYIGDISVGGKTEKDKCMFFDTVDDLVPLQLVGISHISQLDSSLIKLMLVRRERLMMIPGSYELAVHTLVSSGWVPASGAAYHLFEHSPTHKGVHSVILGKLCKEEHKYVKVVELESGVTVVYRYTRDGWVTLGTTGVILNTQGSIDSMLELIDKWLKWI